MRDLPPKHGGKTCSAIITKATTPSSRDSPEDEEDEEEVDDESSGVGVHNGSCQSTGHTRQSTRPLQSTIHQPAEHRLVCRINKVP